MKPLVSIWCMTYNHAEYIRDAIEGFLMQEINFPYEIVIHDDASTDGTVDILKEYETKYPDLIRVIYQKENTYSYKNRKEIINEIKKKELHGKYIAYCEGDDYWTDVSKLQKQVDYMENHEDCIMITHNAVWRDCKKMEDRIINKNYPSDRVGVKELIYQEPVLLATASVMIRKEYMLLTGFFSECGVGDYPLMLYAAEFGYIYYLDEVMSVYRYMANGSWTATTYSDYKKQVLHCVKIIDFLGKYNTYTKKKYENYIIVKINSCNSQILKRIKDLNETEVKELWKDINVETDGVYGKILDKVYECYKNTSSEQMFIAQLKQILAKTDDVTLWGTGKFSNYYEECLKRHNLQVKDYVVSKRNEEQERHLGKNVWEVQELLAEKRNYNIVVGVGFDAWASVLDTMMEYGIENFYSPFYYDIY